jgi:hypothetical protein
MLPNAFAPVAVVQGQTLWLQARDVWDILDV